MARDTNLTRRGAVFYGRVFVPKDLQAEVGKAEIRPSLQTKDYAEAKRRKTAVMDQWAATFDDIRRKRQLTPDDIAAAVWTHYNAGLDAADKERLSKPTTADIDAATEKAIAAAVAAGGVNDSFAATVNSMTDVEILAGRHGWAVRHRTARLKRLRGDLVSGDTRLIERSVDAFLLVHGFLVAKGGDRYRELCAAMMRGEIEQLRRTAERDAGDFTGKPADPIVVEPANTPTLPGAVDETGIMVLFGRYEKENPSNVRSETFYQIRTAVQHFADFAGPSLRAAKISKVHVRQWKDLLADWPVKAAEVTAWKGLSVREIVAANGALDHPKPAISRATLRRYMGNLSGFCAWLSLNDYLLGGNPVAGLLPGKAPPTVKRASFTDNQLKTLFASPLFTTCQGENWRDVMKPGNVAVRDHRYWIPLVMAYSGARPGEIAQLQVADVRQQHGIWVMHITTEGDGAKRTKTASSMRLVPIHSQLINLGFVKHCRAMAAAGQKRAFAEILIPEEGQIAAQFSREFNRYLTRIGVKTDKALVVYSLRHTFIDRARTAGILDQEIGMIVGHDKATMTGRYGTEQEGTLKRRAEIVEAVEYDLH